MSQPTLVKIAREPFGDYFTLTLPNGHTEELEPDDARAWFKEHGAEMDAVEKALDRTWNFYSANFIIENYSEPVMKKSKYAPNLD